MINHHPSDATLFAHSAGTLPSALRRVVRTHLALCPDCGGPAHLTAEICGSLLEGLPEAPMAAGALAGTLARLDLRDLSEPARAAPHTIGAIATGRWYWLAPGIHMMTLSPRDDQDARIDLLRVAPGVSIPDHTHSGLEFTCVLQGGFRDASGDYLAGDFAECDGETLHKPVALPLGEDCICLIATTGRLRAADRLVRAFHRLLGM